MKETKTLNNVLEFHSTYNVVIADKPTIPSPEVCALRLKLIREECDELEAAYKAGDIVEVADALADLDYVVSGSVIVSGLHDQFRALTNEVHRSNMSKLGEDGEPIFREDGKVMKGPNYYKPDLKTVLEISVRQRSIRWWNKLSNHEKIRVTNLNVGAWRGHVTLTGSEIQGIFVELFD